MKPNKEQILAFIRHLLTFTGGMLITNGVVQADNTNLWLEIAGSATSLVGLVWSLFDKRVPTTTTTEVK